MIQSKHTSLFLLIIYIFLTNSQTQAQQKPADFLPNGYVIFETLLGDLNKDGVDDCVLITKGTEKIWLLMMSTKGS